VSTETMADQHERQLSSRSNMADKVRYACEVLTATSLPWKTNDVRAWLAEHGVPTTGKQRPYVSNVVNRWREQHNLGSTGDLPALTDELLAQFDQQAESASANAPVDARTDAFTNTTDTSADASANTHTHAGADTPDASATKKPITPGARWFYAVAFASLGVSLDTSWNFFGRLLQVSPLHPQTFEHVALFGMVEFALVACGFGMASSVHHFNRPGPARVVAWALCGVSAYMALVAAGPVFGLARVLLGPLLGLIMLHLALGIEIRARHEVSDSMWARLGREYRERFLSRVGMANDERDAVQRTRDRAAKRLAHLSMARFVPFRQARLNRAVAASNISHDEAQKVRMLAELTSIKHVRELRTLDTKSPWE
jgi:hypothetical protein